MVAHGQVVAVAVCVIAMSGDTVLICASVTALVVLSVFTFFCSSRGRHGHGSSSSSSHPSVDIELGCWCASAGIDEAELAAFPTTVYFSPRRVDDVRPAAASTDDNDVTGGVRGRRRAPAAARVPARVPPALRRRVAAPAGQLPALPHVAAVYHREEFLNRRHSVSVQVQPRDGELDSTPSELDSIFVGRQHMV